MRTVVEIVAYNVFVWAVCVAGGWVLYTFVEPLL